MLVSELRCAICSRSYSPDDVEYTCPHCGQVGTLDVLYDYDTLRQRVTPDDIARSGEPSMWRYRPLLPLAEDAAVPPLAGGKHAAV